MVQAAGSVGTRRRLYFGSGPIAELASVMDDLRRIEQEIARRERNAEPAGNVPTPPGKDSAEKLRGEFLEGLRQARNDGPLDGVLLDLHGAMVVESLDDGDLIESVRQLVGQACPTVVKF